MLLRPSVWGISDRIAHFKQDEAGSISVLCTNLFMTAANLHPLKIFLPSRCGKYTWLVPKCVLAMLVWYYGSHYLVPYYFSSFNLPSNPYVCLHTDVYVLWIHSYHLVIDTSRRHA